MIRTLAYATLAVSISGALLAAQGQAGDADLVARARAIHERVLTLDTHDDIDTDTFQPACNYTQRLTTQVNLPKMTEGGLDVAFFIVYVGQGPLTDAGYADAYRQAVEKFDAIHRLAEQIAPTQIGLALTPADVRRIAPAAARWRSSASRTAIRSAPTSAASREFHARGGRYLSLAHNGHNQLSDSNTGEAAGDAPNQGISPLGRQVIAEMNRLGMMVDVSHPSKASMLQAVQLSKAPIIASHSAVRALANHSRNLDDEQLLALKKNGGVVQVVAFSAYIKTEPPEQARARAGCPAGGAGRVRRLPPRGRHGCGCSAAGASAGHGEGLRRSHRLRGEADRHRPRRHLVGLRRRRRHRRLEQRVGDVQRHARAGAARLHARTTSRSCGAATCCACGPRSRPWPGVCKSCKNRRVLT